MAEGELPSSPLPDVSTDIISSPAADDGELEEAGEEKGEGEIESGEELEDGEISDEDETLKNERLEPKPVCRFFAKGQCTWGQSCRFLHPGVLDKGNYSMFAAPRPILPGEPEDAEPVRKEEQVGAYHDMYYVVTKSKIMRKSGIHSSEPCRDRTFITILDLLGVQKKSMFLGASLLWLKYCFHIFVVFARVSKYTPL